MAVDPTSWLDPARALSAVAMAAPRRGPSSCRMGEGSTSGLVPTLAETPSRPKRGNVTAILATADEVFRNNVLERLLAAGYDDLEVAELPADLADLLRESEQPLVVVGGIWPAPQPFLRVAVNAGALPLVLLESSALEAEGEALAMGARAALQSDISASSLAAALAAVDAGLIVLEPSARALLLSGNRGRFSEGTFARESVAETPRHLEREIRNNSDPPAQPAESAEHKLSRPAGGLQAQRKGRPLTSREREILALVASGTSNKGIARALSVSANTVKFHLAAVFDKLNAATRAEAVAEAIRRGELSL
jgi:DNA-binding NarL/FixJ family response regulator